MKNCIIKPVRSRAEPGGFLIPLPGRAPEAVPRPEFPPELPREFLFTFPLPGRMFIFEKKAKSLYDGLLRVVIIIETVEM